jgi:polyphosphate kinase 2 (PPK2 family)
VASLDDVDLSVKLSKGAGLKRLQDAQRRLLALRLQAGAQIGDGRLGPPLCVLFEGWDASGKGGAIRRLTAPLDPRHVNVAQFAAPNAREKRHHFLWRFWPELPGWGGMAVLDRSWYGRVLVERVEGFASKPEWRRAYDEIVSFERGLCDEGMVLVKFWMHISEQAQRERFESRRGDPLKSWKLTDEDWRNIARRADYEKAVADMLNRTDHKQAPWRVVAAESKPYARVVVVEAVIEALEQGLREAGQEPIELDAML